jgi:hypothetical protein
MLHIQKLSRTYNNHIQIKKGPPIKYVSIYFISKKSMVKTHHPKFSSKLALPSVATTLVVLLVPLAEPESEVSAASLR